MDKAKHLAAIHKAHKEAWQRCCEWLAERKISADEAAFMELATSNNQGELSPLEIGMHALKFVSASKGGHGKKGGLREYAKKVGKPQSNLVLYRQAAEVLTAITGTDTSMYQFLDRAQHLAAIHKLPRACWQRCCEWLASRALPSPLRLIRFAILTWSPFAAPLS